MAGFALAWTASQPNGYRPKAFVTERAATQLPSRNQSVKRDRLLSRFLGQPLVTDHLALALLETSV